MSRDVYIFRILVALAGFVLLFGLQLRHLYGLQVVRHEELHAKARAKYMTSTTVIGKRGEIRDRRGNLLAGNIATTDILAEPKRMTDETREHVITTLVHELDVDAATLRRRFASGQVEVIVARNVELDRARQVAELALPGVRMIDSTTRSYPKDSLFSNSLGFCDSEGNGAYGLERVWDADLQPRRAEERYERSRRGDRLKHELLEPPDVNGKNVYLTIDEPIQHVMEKALAELYAKFEPSYAYAIMADPKTGAILGMAQYPSFNPNDREHMDPDHWRNHMVGDIFEPGSIMKACSITGAIDYGLVDLDSRFDCEDGMWWYRGKSLRDAGHKFQILEVREIIMHSSNIGTAKIALAMGEARLYQTMLRFGFGQRTDIGLPNESRGILHHPKNWDGLSITRIPMGQGIAATPLQVVQAYGALANGGAMMKLQLVSRIEDPATGEVQVFEPELRRVVARKSSIDAMVEALITVTSDEGTASKARVEGYQVAGKTGTSQKVEGGRYVHGKYFSSFVGFVPAYDPAFVLLVVADQPTKGGHYGGTVCAPTFSTIAEQTLRYLDIPPLPADDVVTPDPSVAATRR